MMRFYQKIRECGKKSERRSSIQNALLLDICIDIAQVRLDSQKKMARTDEDSIIQYTSMRGAASGGKPSEAESKQGNASGNKAPDNERSTLAASG